MGIFVRAVIYGFGFSLGVELYKRASKSLGLDDEPKTKSDAGTSQASDDGDAEPALA